MPMYLSRFAPFARNRLAVLMEQAGDGTSGSSGGGAATPPANSGGQQSQQSQTFSAEYVRELRAEAKEWREKFQALKTENATLKQAAEQAAKDADGKVQAAEKAASDRILQSELKAHAIKAGLVDLDALRLADLSKVKLNDKGEVEGADELFKTLKESKPYLFGQPGNTSTPNNPPPSNASGDFNAKQITDPKQYERAKADFLAQQSIR
ncbi:phage scaffolding protein [uncultured Aquabacterium sp.]|uniref:phage scaffolding protein n=1 Tax=uncultured Aquabacterium sp. TaxID=158753 RepID=UPI0025F5EF37|nr:phage scaffolding protein [uncultured Aquabacterium sp.]